MPHEAKKARALLRQRAEEQLQARQLAAPGPQPEADVRRLLYELQIHQIELEIQNEELRQAQEALEASVERYTDLYDFAPVAYFSLDGGSQIYEANLAAAGLLGVERRRMMGRRFDQFVLNGDRTTFAECSQQAVSQKGKATCELTLLPVNALPRVLHLEIVPHGTGCRLTAIDITERKRAEEALRQSHEGLEARVQERTEELRQANRTLAGEVDERRRAEDAVRQNAGRLAAVAETSRALVEAGFNQQAMLDQATRAVALHIGDACVIRLLSADGEHLEVGAFHHVNPKLHETLKAILATGPVDVAKSLTGHVFQTREATFLPVLSPEEAARLIRPSVLHLIEPAILTGLIVVPLMIETHVLGTLAVYRLKPESPYTRQDLELLQSLADRVALAVTNARLHRDLQTALAHEVDIRQQLIQAEKLSALGRLVGSVAHELNNPLQTITNCLFLTNLELTPDSPIHDYLEMAQAETQRLVDLVGQLRELYRIHPAGTPEARPLQTLLQEVHILMALQMQSAKVRWEQTPAPSSYVVKVIPDRLKQVFINLVGNAIEAMQPAGGDLQIELTPSADGRQVGVIFQDTGPGIAPEYLGHIFEPFFTTKGQGLGLGLSICHEIVQQHGGQITVASQPGQGAQFTVWLPLASGDGTRPEASPAADPADPEGRESPS